MCMRNENKKNLYLEWRKCRKCGGSYLLKYKFSNHKLSDLVGYLVDLQLYILSLYVHLLCVGMYGPVYLEKYKMLVELTTSWVNQHVFFFFNSTFMDLSVLKMYLEHPVLGFWQLSTSSSCWECGGFSGQSSIKIKMYTECCFCCSNWCTWWQYLTTWPQLLPLRPVQLLCKHCHNWPQDKLVLSETLQFPSHLDYSAAIGRFFNTSHVEDQSFKNLFFFCCTDSIHHHFICRNLKICWVLIVFNWI